MTSQQETGFVRYLEDGEIDTDVVPENSVPRNYGQTSTTMPDLAPAVSVTAASYPTPIAPIAPFLPPAPCEVMNCSRPVREDATSLAAATTFPKRDKARGKQSRIGLTPSFNSRCSLRVPKENIGFTNAACVIPQALQQSGERFWFSWSWS